MQALYSFFAVDGGCGPLSYNKKPLPAWYVQRIYQQCNDMKYFGDDSALNLKHTYMHVWFELDFKNHNKLNIWKLNSVSIFSFNQSKYLKTVTKEAIQYSNFMIEHSSERNEKYQRIWFCTFLVRHSTQFHRIEMIICVHKIRVVVKEKAIAKNFTPYWIEFFSIYPIFIYFYPSDNKNTLYEQIKSRNTNFHFVFRLSFQ